MVSADTLCHSRQTFRYEFCLINKNNNANDIYEFFLMINIKVAK